MTAEAKEQKKLAEVSKKRIEESGSLPGSIVTEIVPAFYTAIFIIATLKLTCCSRRIRER